MKPRVEHAHKLTTTASALTGPLPRELGLLSNLTTLDFGYNQLTGKVVAVVQTLWQERTVSEQHPASSFLLQGALSQSWAYSRI